MWRNIPVCLLSHWQTDPFMEHSQGSELELSWSGTWTGTSYSVGIGLGFSLWLAEPVALGYIATNLYKVGLSNESKSAELESGALRHLGLNLRLQQGLDGLSMCTVWPVFFRPFLCFLASQVLYRFIALWGVSCASFGTGCIWRDSWTWPWLHSNPSAQMKFLGSEGPSFLF